MDENMDTYELREHLSLDRVKKPDWSAERICEVANTTFEAVYMTIAVTGTVYAVFLSK